MLRGHARRLGFAAIAMLAFTATVSAAPLDVEPAHDVRAFVQEHKPALDPCIDPSSLETRLDCEDGASEVTTETSEEDEAKKAAVEAATPAQETLEPYIDEVGGLVTEVDLVLRDIERQARAAVDSELQGLLDTLEGDDDSEPLAPESDAAQTDAGMPIEPVLWVAGATAASAAILWALGSSGILGSTGVAGGQSAASTAARRIPGGLPLFTRFEKTTVLEHPNREQLYQIIGANPGVRLQDLCDRTGLSRTAVTHHLRLLEQQHLVVSRRVGRSRHFFENGGRYARDQKKAYAVLQNDRSREIARFIQSNPGSIQKALCEALDLRASVVHWHVQRLQEARLVQADRQGRTVAYFPTGDLPRMGS